MAEAQVAVNVSYASAAELQIWLNNLGTDANAGKVVGFSFQANGTVIVGALTLSNSTAISDLTVAVE